MSWIAFYQLRLAYLAAYDCMGAVAVNRTLPAPDEKNLSEAEDETGKKDRTYDLLLYFVVIFQHAALAVLSSRNIVPFGGKPPAGYSAWVCFAEPLVLMWRMNWDIVKRV